MHRQNIINKLKIYFGILNNETHFEADKHLRLQGGFLRTVDLYCESDLQIYLCDDETLFEHDPQLEELQSAIHEHVLSMRFRLINLQTNKLKFGIIIFNNKIDLSKIETFKDIILLNERDL